MPDPVNNLFLLKQLRQVSHLQTSRCGRARGQGWILISLLERGGMTQRELAAIAQRAPATLCEQLEMMESAGWIVRRKCEADKRNVEVRLTPCGEALAQEALQERRKLADRLFAPLDTQEKQRLSAILQKLSSAWQQSARDVREEQP